MRVPVDLVNIQIGKTSNNPHSDVSIICSVAVRLAIRQTRFPLGTGTLPNLGFYPPRFV